MNLLLARCDRELVEQQLDSDSEALELMCPEAEAAAAVLRTEAEHRQTAE